MQKRFYRLKQSKKNDKSKSKGNKEVDKVAPNVGNHELNRRDFMKLSALVAGGVLASAVWKIL